MKHIKAIKIDKETLDAVRDFKTETILQEIKEDLDRVFGKNVYDSCYDKSWTDEEIAKLDYILSEISMVINKNKNITVEVFCECLEN